MLQYLEGFPLTCAPWLYYNSGSSLDLSSARRDIGYGPVALTAALLAINMFR